MSCPIGRASKNEDVDSLQGQLLIASPGLRDPNFRRTVVLVTEHSDEGAAGLVLNRPSPAAVADVVPVLEPLVEVDEQVWLGGPVQQDAVLVLGEFVDPHDAAVPLFGALGFPSLDEPEEVVTATVRRRVFAGYAGWGAGQLEGEIDAGAWYVLNAAPGDVMCADPTGLWRSVLRRQPGLLSAVSSYPADLSEN